MDKKTNKYIAVSYSLYDVTDGKSDLIEQTQEGRPFDFISGLGIALEAFENEVTPLNKGDKFQFDLTPEQAYGEFMDEYVTDVDKKIFEIDGKFDDEHIQVGAIIPLQNAEGDRFNGKVIEIGAESVKIDLNHPLAGKTLRFCGSILESAEASNEQVAAYINEMNSHQCGGNCGGNCGEDGCNCGDGECGCGK